MTLRRITRILFWLILWVLAAMGLLMLGLAVAGVVQFAALDCGPRNEWTEANYVACSDIDETNAIFLVMGGLAVLPLTVALLIRFLRPPVRAAQLRCRRDGR